MTLGKQETTILPRTWEEYKNQTKAKRKTGANDQMDQEDFLRLLVEQMKNQDPLNPMDNTQFTQQTTAFSQLEQLMNMNKKIDSYIESQNGSAGNKDKLIELSHNVGKKVEFDTNIIMIDKSGAQNINFVSTQAAQNAKVSFYDKNNSFMGSYDIGSIRYGQNSVNWDGKVSGGVQLPEGSYSYKVEALDAAGNEIKIGTYGEGVVSGVRLVGGKIMFELNNGKNMVPVDAVYAVRDANSGRTN